MEADYTLDFGVVSAAGHEQLYLAARIKTHSAHHAANRSPLNMSMVLDRSGSMQGSKITYVKQAAQFLVRQLSSDDRFSLVTYNDSVNVVLPPDKASSHKDQMSSMIQKIRAGGSTNLSGGWLKGCRFVAEGIAAEKAPSQFKASSEWIAHKDEKGLSELSDAQINRVLLLTDGLANRGVTQPERLVQMARDQREHGVPTTTIGVGLNFNEDLLVQMASEGGGNYYFIDNPEQIPQIFEEELQMLAEVVAQNLVISLIPESNVRFVRQLNAYPQDAAAKGVAFRLGDLTAEETKTLVLELSIPDLPTLGEVEIARLRFDYDELQEDRAVHRQIELPVVVNVVAEADFAEQSPHPDVMRDVLRLQAGQARREAVALADQGEFKTASDKLSKVADSIEEADLNDDALQAEHDMLREEAIDMELGARRYDAFARKTSTSAIHHTSTLKGTEDLTELYNRFRGSRQAMERNGDPPTKIKWQGQTLDLTMDALRLGRAEDNDIVIPEKEVSNYHCQVVRKGDNWFLEDLNSANGTFANRGRVKGHFRLSAGDVMTVGSWLFRFGA